MNNNLTDKQKKILRFIEDKVQTDNLPPTIREIAGHFGFSSTGTVRDYLNSLSRKGYIRLKRQKARAIELLQGLLRIPVLGRVAAGDPQTAQQDIEGYLEPELFANKQGQMFALRVKGDSMIEAGIMEGDIVVVRRQPKAESADIVVAMIGDEATVKFLKRSGKRFFLYPANSKYKPIVLDGSAAIIGKVITVIRRYV